MKDHVRIGMEILAPLKHLGVVLTYVNEHAATPQVRNVLMEGDHLPVDALPPKLRSDPLKFEAPQVVFSGIAKAMSGSAPPTIVIADSCVAITEMPAAHHGMLRLARK